MDRGDQQLQEQQRRREATIANRTGKCKCMFKFVPRVNSTCSISPEKAKAASAKLLTRGLVETVELLDQFIHKSALYSGMHNMRRE
jgi:hypothetical protein